MSNPARLEKFYRETQETIEELLAQGSDPEALYLIEHHMCATDRDRLDSLTREAFRLGYEVAEETESLTLDDGGTLFCCDLLGESPLNAKVINDQVRQMMDLADKYQVEYDGWGTWFEDDEEDDEDGDDDQEDYDDDDEDDEVR